MSGPPVQAVTFDVGGTLIEPWPSVGDVYAEVAAEHGVTGLCAAALNRRFTEAWLGNGCRAECRGDWQAVVREAFRDQPVLANDKVFFDSLYERFATPESWHVFEDAAPTLNSLKAAGFRLGILSNWDDRLRLLLDRLDLRRWFEVVTISCEVGCRKPDPAIFRLTADCFRLPPGEIVHVGDSRELDLVGARRAGFRAVLVRRGAAGHGSGSCTSLIDLPARLRMD